MLQFGFQSIKSPERASAISIGQRPMNCEWVNDFLNPTPLSILWYKAVHLPRCGVTLWSVSYTQVP